MLLKVSGGGSGSGCPNDRLPAAPPLLGEHTRDVLREIGYSADNLDRRAGRQRHRLSSEPAIKKIQGVFIK